MQKFSYYKQPIRNIFPERDITLPEVVQMITQDKGLQKTITKLRETKDNTIKTNKLPYITFSGTFNKRQNEELKQHSGLICVDIDGQQVKGLKDITPALMFVSPKGDGQKIVFVIDMAEGEHIEYFYALETYFKKHHKIIIDKACKDVARACFLSHDPGAVMSDSPTILGKGFIKKYTKHLPEPEPEPEVAKMEPGSRNNTLFHEALSAARQKRKKADVVKEFTRYVADDFPLKEIKKVINNAYNTVPDNVPYIRVGVNYFKLIKKEDRHGISQQELKPWNKTTIIEDHGHKYLRNVPKYDDFVMIPDNKNYVPVRNNCYNLYSPFHHKPAPGKFTWSKRMMEHVFGDQLEQGYRYMQILYQYPERSTVILALVSKDNKTGKTTFINWLNMLFGQNVAIISSGDFVGSFNSAYATKNILCIEETMLEKRLTNEKLKATVTSKYITVNEKFIVPYKIPFFGKVVLASNNVDRFALVDQKETRYFVRKLGKPEHFNASIEDDLLKEIPAFLHQLDSRAPVDWSKDRSGFVMEEITNKDLQAVKDESRSELYKDLEERITDWFLENQNEDVLEATPIKIKDHWYPNNSRVPAAYIKRVLRDEFELERSEKVIRYRAFWPADEQVGQPYIFRREDFVKPQDEAEDLTETLPF